jgi:hypothetical protein
MRALVSGFVGAVAVNLVHEMTRYAAGGNPSSDRVPRLDRLGQDGVVLAATSLGLTPPHKGAPRYATAMAGDLLLNAGLYALTSSLTRRPMHGGMLSAVAAGVSGLLLPKLMGLERHTGTTPTAKAMTFADYAVGGIVTGLMLAALKKRNK